MKSLKSRLYRAPHAVDKLTWGHQLVKDPGDVDSTRRQYKKLPQHEACFSLIALRDAGRQGARTSRVFTHITLNVLLQFNQENTI